MDSDQPPSTGRKVRFTPKVPPRTRSQIKAAAQQLKAEEADEAAKAQQLRSHFHELDSIRRQQSKPGSKSSVQPTFINVPKQSSASKASNVPHDQSHDRESSRLELNDNDNENFSIHSSFTDDPRERKMTCAFDSPPQPKDYREPWDYVHTYYPTTVPWRRPYSGDPDILNEAEFGAKVSRTSEYDENAINPASELGFLDLDEANENTRLIFFQLPPSLPFMKRSASAKGKEKESTSVAQYQRAPVTSAVEGKGSSVRVATSQRLRSLEELPAGNLGKLVVYKSGALKLKLGDVLFDVSPGSDCSTVQEVMAVNTKDEECCALGELHNRAVVTPAIDNLLDSVIDLC